jgi:hypothetical protein
MQAMPSASRWVTPRTGWRRTPIALGLGPGQTLRVTPEVRRVLVLGLYFVSAYDDSAIPPTTF